MEKKEKILITGSAGFIGVNLMETLIKRNFIIAAMDRSPRKNNVGVTEYIGDITDYNFVEKSIKDFNPNIVFHLAGFKERTSNVEDVLNSLNVNLLGTLNLYQALLKSTALKSLVTLGTTDEYGDSLPPYDEELKELPVSSYGFSKLCATKLSEFFFRNFKLPVTVLRPTIAYGPHQGLEMFIPSLINTLVNDKVYKMTAGEQTRDFIYISDLISAMLIASESSAYAGQVFNIGSGEVIKIKDVAQLIAKHLNKVNLLKIGSVEYRKREIMHYHTNIAKAKDKMKWNPKIEFNQGLALTIDYYKINNG
ncbi:MAG: NAD-dependent epimerase/dehydratase family protein [Lutibacter sp.]